MSETTEEVTRKPEADAQEIPVRSVVCAIPKDLEPFRPAISAAIFYLSLGREPRDLSKWENIPRSACKSTRMAVYGRSVRLLERLSARLGSERQAVIRALAWVAEQPADQIHFLSSTTIY